MRKNMKISKTALLLASEHIATRRNVASNFRILFAMLSFKQKRLCELNVRENGTKKGFTKMTDSLFRRI